MRISRAISFALFAALTLSTAPALAKSPKPPLAQIEAAKKVEDDKKKAADAQAAKLAAANQNLRDLTAKANAATDLYVRAQKELAIAVAASQVAAQYALETEAAVTEAHHVIGKLATNAYIMGGSMSDIQPLLSANGPQDLMDQLSTLSTLGSKNTIALERFKAAEVIAKALPPTTTDRRGPEPTRVVPLVSGPVGAPRRRTTVLVVAGLVALVALVAAALTASGSGAGTRGPAPSPSGSVTGPAGTARLEQDLRDLRTAVTP